MIKVGILGATGYAGAELVRILVGHPNVKITCLTSRQYAGQRFDQIYPAMKGWVDLSCELYDPDRSVSKMDVAFLALPHKLPMDIVPGLLKKISRLSICQLIFALKMSKHTKPTTRSTAHPSFLIQPYMA